ncbi:hypothetical protein P7D43_18740 [Enterococcus avium]|uniref:Uncharacterized protein n=1 Tax=Enterococcus avium TaxID=33945 RepID=A0AAW8RWS5_ENTAV|nr:hypothetical protein [Enterococcus avium]MDT2404407.1 hypothetical protein [Enterococcus avium]MDT2434275.1 hypothetical protein [Enterococcus avium]MDT2468224.1 hypothetical protein [Enterococcus avium]MDT2485582.1 hypothetical protein [Enterococcus avium]MDT2507632.1 hypothetical protein [Enterococcus avium]
MKEKYFVDHMLLYPVIYTLNIFIQLDPKQMLLATLCITLLFHFFFKGFNNLSKKDSSSKR